jgi:hypothetical protein
MIKIKFKLVIFWCLVSVVAVIFFLVSQFNIFSLSPEQVKTFLPRDMDACHKLMECHLQPGDILIRRLSTSRTKLFQSLFKPYFTHTAFYYGDGLLIEAVGNEPNSANDIQIDNLSLSDWAGDLEGWVIIRPTISKQKINIIKNNLKAIADDAGYTFGVGDKKTSCAELIFAELNNSGVVFRDKSVPKVVTPDFLFQYTAKKSNQFVIIGYGFNEK